MLTIGAVLDLWNKQMCNPDFRGRPAGSLWTWAFWLGRDAERARKMEERWAADPLMQDIAHRYHLQVRRDERRCGKQLARLVPALRWD